MQNICNLMVEEKYDIVLIALLGLILYSLIEKKQQHLIFSCRKTSEI